MATAAQLAANRANARKSTGPRTTAGKARVSRNAVRHGLRSKQPLQPDPSDAEFHEFLANWESELEPATALQHEAVLRLALTLWRYRCASRLEVELLSKASNDSLPGTLAYLGRLLEDTSRAVVRAVQHCNQTWLETPPREQTQAWPARRCQKRRTAQTKPTPPNLSVPRVLRVDLPPTPKLVYNSPNTSEGTGRMSLKFKVLIALFTAALFAAATENWAPLGEYKARERKYWAYQEHSRPELPAFTDANDQAWTQNPIDAFILEKLHEKNLQPAPPADRATLIRRAYFDITGLPPSPAEVDAFVEDSAPDAWNKVVERLLASPRYGERWGQHWLDVVRFAETDGFEYDNHRPDAWRFRDYVIRSFNEDKPYDHFVREQLAGDEIAPHDEEMRVAAGFQRLAPLRLNAGNQEVASSRNEELTEMANIVGAAFIGMTIGCARCHDHKFDAIRQSDYYRVQAYFAATHPRDVPLAPPEERIAWQQKTDAAKAEVKRLQKAMKDLEGPEKQRMEKKMEAVKNSMPTPLPALYSVSNDYEKVSQVNLLSRGDHTARGDRVGMRPPGVLLPEAQAELPPDTANPRTQLANWITRPEHPLTARVMANRVWHYHFGQGIVNTPNDFGLMGGRPTHPQLIDFLANWLVDGGWRIKPLHRLILLSNTYQQSSDSPIAAKAMETDADNKYLWKFTRRRLSAEEIRDAALSVSGLLNLKTGGPSVMVPVDQELIDLMYKPEQWVVTKPATEHNRRSIYLIAKRNLRLPFMEVFDAPDLQISCQKRETSTHPPQALELLNGDFNNRMAEALAQRLKTEAGDDPIAQAEYAFRLAAGRPPTAKEAELALTFLAPPLPTPLVPSTPKTSVSSVLSVVNLPRPPVSPAPTSSHTSAREFALAVLNLNAFLYVN